MKKKMICLLVVCLMISSIPTALADRFSEYGWDADTTGYLAVVANPKLGDRLNLREKPDTDAKSLGRFYSGTPVYVVSRNTERDSDGREWARVDMIANFDGGAELTGWMLKDYLMPMNVNFEAPQLFYKAYARKSTNLLSEPRNGAEVVGQAGSNELYVLGDIGDDWRLVANSDRVVGYIRAARIQHSWMEVKDAYLFPADGGGYVPIYEDQELTKVRAKMYPGASVRVIDCSKTKGWATVESFGVPSDMKNEWVWQADISGYARLEDVTVFIQPWQAKVNLRTGKAKTDLKLDDATIPAGASVTVVGEMKDKYQILYGDAASGWHVTAMAPASQITLTAFSANVRGPAAQGFALLPKNDIDPDNEIDTLVSTVSFPGDTWQEGEAYTDRRLAEIIGEVERNGVSYWQLRNQDCGNFYYEKDKCEALLYADMDNARGIVRNVNGTWTATKAEQGLWYYALQAGQEGLLTLKKPDGTVVEYEVYEEMPKETTYAFFLQEGEQVTVQGEGELHPLVKGREPMLLPQYPGDYEENETIFEGSGRFYCDMQIPNVVNYFTLMIRPLPGSANSYAAVSNLFGDADSTELINFFPVPEGGWEHEGTVCENDFAWQEYDCSVFPGMFLEVHNCTVSVFFGNG